MRFSDTLVEGYDKSNNNKKKEMNCYKLYILFQKNNNNNNSSLLSGNFLRLFIWKLTSLFPLGPRVKKNTLVIALVILDANKKDYYTGATISFLFLVVGKINPE